MYTFSKRDLHTFFYLNSVWIIYFYCSYNETENERNEIVSSVNVPCAVHKDGVIAESAVCKWFARFRTENFNLEDCEHSDKLTYSQDFNKKNYPSHTTQDIMGIRHICHGNWIIYNIT